MPLGLDPLRPSDKLRVRMEGPTVFYTVIIPIGPVGSVGLAAAEGPGSPRVLGAC